MNPVLPRSPGDECYSDEEWTALQNDRQLPARVRRERDAELRAYLVERGLGHLLTLVPQSLPIGQLELFP